MGAMPHPGERISLALDALDIKQVDLARTLDVPPQQLNQVVSGERPGKNLLDRIATALGVDVLWLRTGAEALAPAWARVGPLNYDTSTLALVGIVKAGDGDLTELVEPPPAPFPLKASWRVLQVMGWSAYPVVYPEQFVITDESRATNPSGMTDAHRTDLHDNIVICQVQTIEDGKEKKSAYLKRFCHAPGAPGDFILASVDGGRSSPYVDPAHIIVIEPVVGVLFEDPRLPRKKKGKLNRKDGR